jgi:hypothetical protein
MLVKEQDKPKALNGLDGYRSATDGIAGLLDECFGKSTKSRSRSWHRGFLSLLGFEGVHLLLTEMHSNHDVICGTDHLDCNYQFRRQEGETAFGHNMRPGVC